MNRRALLTGIGAGLGSLAGCPADSDAPAGSDSGSTTPTGVPGDCPVTQALGVAWPDELDASAVESFVEEYEHRYYRDVVVGYEPRSRLDAYQLSVSIADGPTSNGAGYEIQVWGGGGVYNPRLHLEARESDPPDAAEVIPGNEFDGEALHATLVEAAETGEAERRIRSGPEIDRYLDLLDSVSGTFEPLPGPGDSDAIFVDVDGTVVELSVRATRFHGDYGWLAWYYVDERVVRRTADDGTDPRDGELLECRERE